MKVSDLVVQILKQHGVKYLYGIPGDAINDIMESVRVTDDVTFVQVKHEESGALAASIQSKLTGKLTACVGTSGPGAIHLLNGLYDAKLDHAPVIAITGQVETQYLGTNHHQEVDLETLFSDVAVYSQTLTTAAQLPNVLLEGCRAAIRYRGVAHISIPSDVAGKNIDFEMADLSVSAYAAQISPSSSQCEEATQLIDASAKVAILAGIGCQEAVAELKDLATHLNAPIIRTLRAKDIIDDSDPLCAGGLGLLGGKPAIDVLASCDLLIMAGTDFPYREFYPDRAKVMQIDIEATQIGKRHPVDVGLVGNARPILRTLKSTCRAKPENPLLSQAQEDMAKWHQQQAKDEQAEDTPLKPQRLLHSIGEHAPDNAIFVCDTGTINAWSARHLTIKPGQRFTLSSALGTMGVALPGAIGAQLAYPDRPVYALAGDGGFAMTMTDLMTAVSHQLPIRIIVLNNEKLGFIGLEQEAKGLPAFGIKVNNIDFVQFAAACGVHGVRVTSPDELELALTKALDHQGPMLIDVAVDPDALIMPPKIEWMQALNFAKAKVKEWLL